MITFVERVKQHLSCDWHVWQVLFGKTILRIPQAIILTFDMFLNKTYIALRRSVKCVIRKMESKDEYRNTDFHFKCIMVSSEIYPTDLSVTRRDETTSHYRPVLSWIGMFLHISVIHKWSSWIKETFDLFSCPHRNYKLDIYSWNR